jgi:beta-barrel assembly-enhancing protease
MSSFQALRYVSKTRQSYTVQIELDMDGIQVTDSIGTQELVPYTDLELVPVGYMDNQTILRVKSTGDTLRSDDLNLLKALQYGASGPILQQIKARLDSRKRESTSLTVGWIAVACGLVCAIVLVFFGTNITVDWALMRIPPSLESQWGELSFNSYAQYRIRLDETREGQRVARLGDALVRKLPHNDYTFKFHLIQSPYLNAFAFPGGNVVVFSEVVMRAGSDDELAAVLAHEIGHVMKRHSLRIALHEAGMWGCLQVIFKGHGQQLQSLLKEFLNLDKVAFSRAQEEEADKTGVRLALAAGYDPNAFITFFERLKKQDTGQDNRYFALLSDHPMTSEREEYIKKEIAAARQEQSTGVQR